MCPFESEAVDWLAVCRRSAAAVKQALETLEGTTARARWVGRGEGGDTTLAVDRAAEDAILRELSSLPVGVRVTTEERGDVALGDGAGPRVVVDPIDGSLNAKRGLPAYSVSLAVADGDTMADVSFGYVLDLSCDEEWWAERGGGAWCAGSRLDRRPDSPTLEILGVESAQPDLVAGHAILLASAGAHRLRMIGSIALSLCYVASSRFDALVSLRRARSVDAAAGQLIVREAGAAVVFPDTADGSLGADLSLDMRSRVVAAADGPMLEQLCETVLRG